MNHSAMPSKVSDSVTPPIESISETIKETINKEETILEHKEAPASDLTNTERVGKLCKSTWLGTECQISDCSKVQIKPCHNRECRALYDGLPLYIHRKCQFWHVRPKTKKLKSNDQRKTGGGQTGPNVSKQAGYTPLHKAAENGLPF